MRGFVVLNRHSRRFAPFRSVVFEHIERFESGGILLNACQLLLAGNFDVGHRAIGMIAPEPVAKSALGHTSLPPPAFSFALMIGPMVPGLTLGFRTKIL